MIHTHARILHLFDSLWCLALSNLSLADVKARAHAHSHR